MNKLDTQRLKEILKNQIEWYKEHKDDEDYLYDMAYEQFNNLRRGEFKEILELLSEDREPTPPQQ